MRYQGGQSVQKGDVFHYEGAGETAVVTRVRDGGCSVFWAGRGDDDVDADSFQYFTLIARGARRV